MQDFLADIEQEETIQIVYHLTSIYDNSIYEAFSKIIQKLIRELPILEHLLDILREVNTKRKTEGSLSFGWHSYTRILVLKKPICLIR